MKGLLSTSMIRLAVDMRLQAQTGTWDGRHYTAYFARCIREHPATGTRLIFSRDVGHHTSGWWKNPDYERCKHLSLSFMDPGTDEPASFDHKLAALWIESFFGDNRRLLWCEPPYFEVGKARNVWHYRLFCDPAWEPILPRGEVYTREFTEAGWKSWSDVQADAAKALAAIGGAP